ncbi:hypothetical protein IQ07DRAFT_138761 [Pyrenochaeta sp. DS3sAY3a]|nr:hypothetical protein IQ07DRAFT_138761 [Pyrenochaeta sp. DS3sAY3a]
MKTATPPQGWGTRLPFSASVISDEEKNLPWNPRSTRQREASRAGTGAWGAEPQNHARLGRIAGDGEELATGLCMLQCYVNLTTKQKKQKTNARNRQVVCIPLPATPGPAFCLLLRRRLENYWNVTSQSERDYWEKAGGRVIRCRRGEKAVRKL